MMFSRDAGTNQINDVVMIDFQVLRCFNLKCVHSIFALWH